MKTIDNLLAELNACEPARDWAKGKPWPEVYATCDRGDWLLWLFKRTNPDDLRLLTLAKGLCANTVRHLMTDSCSVAAVDAAIAFGEGRSTREELAAAYAAAAAAYAASSASYAASAAYAAGYAAAAAASAASAAAYAASAAAGYAAAARVDSLRQLADIVRQTIAIDKFAIL